MIPVTRVPGRYPGITGYPGTPGRVVGRRRHGSAQALLVLVVVLFIDLSTPGTMRGSCGDGPRVMARGGACTRPGITISINLNTGYPGNRKPCAGIPHQYPRGPGP
eukprot:1944165-Rhodomonas_salina.1